MTQTVDMLTAITSTMRALPTIVDADVRRIFLAGYLSDFRKLPCPLDKFDAAADAFLKDTGVTSDDWEKFLAIIVAGTIASVDDYQAFRVYIGKAVEDYKIAVATPAQPVVAPVEVALFRVIPTRDVELLRSFSKYTKPLPGIPVGQVLIGWRLQVEGESLWIDMLATNSEGGPVVHASLMDYQGTILATSAPTQSIDTVHKLAVPGKIYSVTLRPE